MGIVTNSHVEYVSRYLRGENHAEISHSRKCSGVRGRLDHRSLRLAMGMGQAEGGVWKPEDQAVTAENFQTALKRTLVYEGGYSNHPKDPGGVTLEGVIQRVYDGYRDRKGLPRRALTPQMRGQPDWIAERDEIYKVQYWDRVRGDELPIGVDAVVFDGAVNSGPGQSIKWLQRALMAQGAALTADGMAGEATLAAVQYSPNNEVLIKQICGRRLAFLKGLSTWSTFGKGWTDRVVQVQAAGVAQARGAAVADAAKATVSAKEAENGSAKGNANQLPTPIVSPNTGTAATTGSSVATGAAEALQNATTTLQQFSDTIAYVKYALFGIAMISLCITIYSLWRANKSKQLESGDAFTPVPEAEDA